MNLIVKTIREHEGREIEKRKQEINCSRNIYWDRRCAEKKTITKRQPARYKESLSNSAKNTKDEHLLCTAKQKYYNLSKFEIANSLSSANKNDPLHLEEAEKGQGKIGNITDGAIGTKKGRNGKKTLVRNSGKVI